MKTASQGKIGSKQLIWKQFIWKLLSLWAVLALAMPSLAWACPMSGSFTRASAPTCPCLQAAAKPQSGALDTALHKCCKKLPLPASDTSGDHKNGSPTIPNLSAARIDAPDITSTPLLYTAFILPSPAQIPAPEYSVASLSTSSPPRLLAQNLSRPCSGRSPPL